VKVHGLVADYSGCGWYRLIAPLTEYQRRGGSATWGHDFTPEIRAEADVIIGQRPCTDDVTKVWQHACRHGDALMVLDLDDDLWNIDPSSKRAHRTFTPAMLDNLRANIAAADVVTVSTEPLAEVVRPMNPNVRVVPNRIPAWLLEHARPRCVAVTIGWAGSTSHSMDWDNAGPQVGRFLARNRDVLAHVIGSTYSSMRSWPAAQLRNTGWLGSVDDYYRSIDFDIALAPLKPHTFNRSKSNLRLLELSALGIPTVASNVGPYADRSLHGVRGFLVDRDHEWPKYLAILVNDNDLRREMGANARGWAYGQTVEAHLDQWLEAWGLKTAIGR
jgi:glycosyltransferase involved in cell wall biosynthesis